MRANSPPGIVTCGFLSVREWFHPLASARSIFMPMIHAGPRSSCTTRCIFISISRRGANPAQLSMIRSSKVIQYSRNVAAQRSRSVQSILFLPSSSPNGKGEEIRGRGSLSFFFFLLPFLVSILLCPNIELLIPNIEQRYARKRKTEIAITACLIFDES